VHCAVCHATGKASHAQRSRPGQRSKSMPIRIDRTSMSSACGSSSLPRSSRVFRDRVLNVRSAGEFAERVGLIRATKRRTNERNASVTAVGPGSRPRKEMKDSGK